MKKAFIIILFISFSSIDIAEARGFCETLYERCIDSNPHTGWFDGVERRAYDKACLNSRTGCQIFAE
jgi:hypothetical protein